MGAGETMADILAPVAEAVASGVILHVGLSNCTVADIEAAAASLPAGCLVSVQNKYGLNDRSAERDGVLDYCEEHGLAFIPYGTFGGSARRGKYGEGRKNASAFDPEHFPALHVRQHAVLVLLGFWKTSTSLQ